MIFIEYIQRTFIEKSVIRSYVLQIKQFIHSWMHFYGPNALSSHLLNKSDFTCVLTKKLLNWPSWPIHTYWQFAVHEFTSWVYFLLCLEHWIIRKKFGRRGNGLPFYYIYFFIFGEKTRAFFWTATASEWKNSNILYTCGVEYMAPSILFIGFGHEHKTQIWQNKNLFQFQQDKIINVTCSLNNFVIWFIFLISSAPEPNVQNVKRKMTYC